MNKLSDNRMLFALVSGITIFAVSVLVGWIFFGILQSTAQVTVQNWSLGGAIAGFAFSAILLTSITFQFYKQVTADELSKYRDQIAELQSKLIRGAPTPPGHSIEVDEKHKLVFSRPERWLPRQGILYQFIEKQVERQGETVANFVVSYQSKEDLKLFYKNLEGLKVTATNNGKLESFQLIDIKKTDVDKLYEDRLQGEVQLGLMTVQAQFGSYENVNLTKEFILVDGIKSLKAVLSYTIAADGSKKQKINLCQCFIFIYVPNLEALYSFTFTDSEEKYLNSSEVFNGIIASIRFLP